MLLLLLLLLLLLFLLTILFLAKIMDGGFDCLKLK
jgi:hypothetical protein